MSLPGSAVTPHTGPCRHEGQRADDCDECNDERMPRFSPPGTTTVVAPTWNVFFFATFLARTMVAQKRQTVRDELVLWHARCKEQEHRTFKWKRRVDKETEFFNGRALTGQYQRSALVNMCIS